MKVSEGDESAFRELFNYWQPLFSNYIYSITKSKELSAEIVQDVFLKIWLKRETLSQVEHFKAYLFKISRNEALNALRKTMREIKVLEEWERLQRDNSSNIPDDNPLHQQLAIVDEAIEELSDRQKEIYKLHRHERLTYQQIAERLGIGRETVKTHLDNAVSSIKKKLNSRMLLLLMLTDEISRKM